MTEKEKYWLAGLLEGEGSFMKGPPSDPNRPRITIGMTDRDVIEKVADLFGVEYIAEIDREDYKTSYKVQIRGMKAIDLMCELRPLMGERRQQQIDKAANSYDQLSYTESQSNHSRDEVKIAWTLIQQDQNTLSDVAEEMGMSMGFVKDLSAGRTWSKLTGQ